MALSINVLPLCVLNLIGERHVSHLKNCIYILPKHINMQMFFVLGKLQKDIIIFGSIVDGFPVLSILCYFELLHNSKLTPAQNAFIIKKKKIQEK